METDQGYHYFVAGWRGLWSWNSCRVAEDGSNTARLKCQQSNCSANKRDPARCCRRHRSIAVRGDGPFGEHYTKSVVRCCFNAPAPGGRDAANLAAAVLSVTTPPITMVSYRPGVSNFVQTSWSRSAFSINKAPSKGGSAPKHVGGGRVSCCQRRSRLPHNP